MGANVLGPCVGKGTSEGDILAHLLDALGKGVGITFFRDESPARALEKVRNLSGVGAHDRGFTG
jgi:hypothetical protein